MALRIFNTLTRRKEDFVPVVPGEARVYVCGVTVYDLCHIGHARSAIVFDVIRRYLRFRDYKVTFIKNYTDVDDKLIAESNKRGVPDGQLAADMTADYMNNIGPSACAVDVSTTRLHRDDGRDRHVHPDADREGFRLRGARATCTSR